MTEETKREIVDFCNEVIKSCKNCEQYAEKWECIDCTEGGRAKMAKDILTVLENHHEL